MADDPYAVFNKPATDPYATFDKLATDPYAAFNKPKPAGENAWDKFKEFLTSSDEPVKRGAILPFGETAKGKPVLALPEIIAGPKQTVQNLLGGLPVEKVTGEEIFNIGGLASPTSVAPRIARGMSAARPKVLGEVPGEITPPTKPAPESKSTVTALRNILSPTSAGPLAKEAEASIRSTGGRAARDTATSESALEPYHARVNALPESEKLGLLDYIERRSSQGATTLEKGFVRFYHGGDERTTSGGGGRWVTPDEKYARGWAGDTGKIYYVDIPETSPLLKKSFDDTGTSQKAPYVHFEAPEGIAKNLKPLSSSKIDPNLQPVADEVRKAMDMRRSKIEAMPKFEGTSFVKDYYPHFWKDPAKAENFIRTFSGGTGKQGSGASLKKRSIPTIADGIAAGLEPAFIEPLEGAMRYVRSMDQFLAATEVLEAAKAQGTVKYIQPKVTGASGHPDSLRVPDGWVPLNGRGSTNVTGAKAYAPEDWARIYNNFIDRGIHKNADWGKIYDTVQRGSNAITAFELGLSGFHAFTMANEAFISGLAKSIAEIAGGKPIRAISSIVQAPTKPITNYRAGKKIEQIYLGRSPGTPDMRRVTDLLTEAGGRAKGFKHAADYSFSAMNSYWTSFKRGALKAEMRAELQGMKDQPLLGPAKTAMRQIGRIMSTVAQPLFEKYIPRVKNGAFYDTMQMWLETNPKATHEQQVAIARKIWDSIDNRFGEMVQDNVFWNKTLKQVSQLAMRSYSWNLGTVREIGLGAKDLLRDPRSLSPASEKWSPRSNYVVALPIAVGTLNAAYQYLKTGKAPESIEDLVNGGRTGGTTPGVGGRGEVPERISLPGYQKDVFGWYHDWLQEAKNKIATGPRMIGELASNKNWKGDPIINPESSAPEWMKQYFKYAYETLGPISLRQLIKGEKTGSSISKPESITGLRPAPMHLQDPEGSRAAMKRIHDRDWKRKERYEKRQKMQYGGPADE